MSAEIVARLSRVVWTKEDSSFCVAHFVEEGSQRRFTACGPLIVSGPKGDPGALTLRGDWQQSPKYGERFVVEACELVRPKTIEGLVQFLQSSARGVGEVTARKLLVALEVSSPDEFAEVCYDAPERIYEFFRPTRKHVADGVLAAVKDNESQRRAMIFLAELGVGPGLGLSIYKRFQERTIQEIQENPYGLIGAFRSVGFLRADAIALKLGVPQDSPRRIEAALIHALNTAEGEGHVCLPRDTLMDRGSEVLRLGGGTTMPPAEVLARTRELYKECGGSESFSLRHLPGGGESRGSALFYLPRLLHMEDFVSQVCVALLSKDGGSSRVDARELAPQVPWESLSEEQTAAVQLSLSQRLMVLTGGPGCGKTYVLRAMCGLQHALGRKVVLCAPTGLAAKRMGQAIGQGASTIHRLLGLGGGDTESDTSSGPGLSDADVVVVDEASMLSLDLFYALLGALGTERRLVLVGDVDQLPSVGAGNCLRDLLDSGQVPFVRLTKIFRQGERSGIPLAARSVIEGRAPEFRLHLSSGRIPRPADVVWMECDRDSFYPVLEELVTSSIPAMYGLDPSKDCQVLVPIRKGVVGQEAINLRLQALLNPPGPEKAETRLDRDGPQIRVGDKVIQTKNNYRLGVFNGDRGTCVGIVKLASPGADGNLWKIDVLFDEERIVTFGEADALWLQVAYAITVHKSQGSEFRLCIVPVFSAHYVMLERNLLYTAITRASEVVVVLGERPALLKAVRTVRTTGRHTALRSLIRLGCGQSP